MAQPYTGRIDDFRGVAQDIAPGRLPPALFQADEGGDLSARGTWRVRKGQTKLGFDPGVGAARTVYAFRTPAGSLGFVIIDDAGNFRGFAYVTSAGAPVPTELPADRTPGPAFRPMWGVAPRLRGKLPG